jgi:hypothetical protein
MAIPAILAMPAIASGPPREGSWTMNTSGDFPYK